jgi:hypothetical protein
MALACAYNGMVLAHQAIFIPGMVFAYASLFRA